MIFEIGFQSYCSFLSSLYSRRTRCITHLLLNRGFFPKEPETVPGLTMTFPDILSSSTDIFSKHHTCCHRNLLLLVSLHIFVDIKSRIQFPETLLVVLQVIIGEKLAHNLRILGRGKHYFDIHCH